jgi:nucleoside-diphosphate-sugar epimerase
MQGSKLAAIVTGGSGFIGTHLVSALIDDASISRVFILDRSPSRIASDKIEFIGCDLREEIQWSPPAGSHELLCFHLAAICREPGYAWDDYFLGNSRVAENVARWATRIGLSNIIFISTSMVFRASDKRHSESDMPNPDSAYGISKALSEEIFRRWAAAKAERRLYVLRPGIVFGKGCGENFVRLYRAVRRNLFCYVGRSSTVKSATYVKDLVRVLRAAANGDLEPGIYHALFPDPVTVRSIVEAFCNVYGWRRYIPTLPYGVLMIATLPFQFASALGLRNAIHPRRIQKIYNSTNLSAERLVAARYPPAYSLTEAIRDWRNDCLPADLY